MHVAWRGPWPRSGILRPEDRWHPRGEERVARYRVDALALPETWHAASEAWVAPADGAAAEETGGVRAPGLHLIAGPFKRRAQTIAGVDYVYFSHPAGSPRSAGYTLGQVHPILERFVRDAGPRPFRSLRLVELGGGDALFGPGLVGLPTAGRAPLDAERIAECLAPLWWGGALIPDREQEVAFAGLASLLAHPERLEAGEPGRSWRRRVLLDANRARAALDPVERAAARWLTLRSVLGASVFDVALRSLVAQPPAEPVGAAALRRAFGLAGGPRVGALAAAWLGESALPELALTEVANVGASVQFGGTVRAASALSVELELEFEAGRGRHDVSLPAEGPWSAGWRGQTPVRVSIDPEAWLLRELQPEERPASLARLLDRGPELIVIGSGRGGAEERAARRFATSIPGARVRLDRELTRADLAAVERVLLVGLPDFAALERVALALPDTLLQSSSRLGVGGRAFETPRAFVAHASPRGTPGLGVLVVLDTLDASRYELLWRALPASASYAWLLGDGAQENHRGVAELRPAWAARD